MRELSELLSTDAGLCTETILNSFAKLVCITSFLLCKQHIRRTFWLFKSNVGIKVNLTSKRWDTGQQAGLGQLRGEWGRAENRALERERPSQLLPGTGLLSAWRTDWTSSGPCESQRARTQLRKASGGPAGALPVGVAPALRGPRAKALPRLGVRGRCPNCWGHLLDCVFHS